MKKNVQWLVLVLICIIASVASVFLPVLTYIFSKDKLKLI